MFRLRSISSTYAFYSDEKLAGTVQKQNGEWEFCKKYTSWVHGFRTKKAAEIALMEACGITHVVLKPGEAKKIEKLFKQTGRAA